jgi:uncharacterized membrane protein YfcA
MSPLSLVLGTVVGFSLGLTGGGGAIFAVPLLVYGMARDPRQAVGVSLITVAGTALVGFVQRMRARQVEYRIGLLFAVAGMLTTLFGVWLSRQLPESLLLVTFGLLMLVIAVRMWIKAKQQEPASVCIPVPGNAGERPKGMFIELLRKELQRRDLEVPFLAHDLIAELQGDRSLSTLSS